MAQKRIIQGQPSYTDTSQYNFADNYSGNLQEKIYAPHLKVTS